ncbi:MAG: YigZ family protein [Oscillospiraceae bacterium]|nr:YigZ family protein [Oscillospiraceae bacterium]
MEYRTIAQASAATLTEKKSEFIAQLFPVKTSEEAIACIESVKKNHRKARHNVYAYIVRDQNTSRYSDDGEPQGTAGMPVLDVLMKNQLTDICCVVTRYFGGILLGGGGLVRAYSGSTSLAVQESKIMVMRECVPVTLTMDYSLYGKVSYILPQYGVLQTDSDFGNNVVLTLLVQSETAEKLKADLTDLTNGQITIETGEKQYADFSEIVKDM